MWLPDWLYKTMPHIYAVVGILAICIGKDDLGIGSGMLLVYLAFLILHLRKENRESGKIS
jgi:hypothetical protein